MFKTNFGNFLYYCKFNLLFWDIFHICVEENRQTYRYSTYCKPITCPVCRRRTDITRDDVASLPDNFLISSLVGIIKDKAEESTACQICKRGRHKGRSHR